jgi:hypothetical protein
MISYIFLFYCFLSVVLITGGTFFFYSSGQQVTGVIYFLGSIVGALVFGFRWFPLVSDSKSTGTWPPSINYCPDLLTLATVGGTQACIDTVGVSQQGGMSTSDGTQTGDQYVFNLFLDKIGNERVASLCDQARQKNVTWEGVWDGSMCSNVEPPRPGV